MTVVVILAASTWTGRRGRDIDPLTTRRRLRASVAMNVRADMLPSSSCLTTTAGGLRGRPMWPRRP
jgi:hypothetical protein